MKMTYKEIEQNHKALMAIGNLTLPRKASVAIARNIVKLEKEYKIKQEQKRDILNRYAKKDEAGEFVLKECADNSYEYIFESVEDRVAFEKEIRELNSIEVEVDVMKISDSILDRCDEVEKYNALTPVQEAAIEWMIDYDDETDDLA